jgi:hypothetical protein
MHKFLSLAIILTALTWACSDKIENPALTITPTDYLQLADTGKIVRFSISASPYENHRLKSFKIDYFTKTQKTQVLLDSALGNVSNFNMAYEFTVPHFTDTTEVTLEFNVTDEAGNHLMLTRKLLVNVYSVENTLLAETAGNTLYADPGNHPTAFDLLECKALDATVSDSTQMHLLASFDTLRPATLTRKWTSPAKLKFVKFNDFDYANATATSVKNSFEGGVQVDFLTNVTSGNIYLTKVTQNKTTHYIAIKVQYVYDNAGIDNRYEFNVKK